MRILFSEALTDGKSLGELPAKNLSTATNRAVLALQMQTGLTVLEIRQQAKFLRGYVIEFLTLHDALHSAGLPQVSWEQILDMTDADSRWIPDPGDTAAAPKEAAPGEDRGDTREAVAPAISPKKVRTASKPKTPGSRRKSVSASPAS